VENVREQQGGTLRIGERHDLDWAAEQALQLRSEPGDRQRRRAVDQIEQQVDVRGTVHFAAGRRAEEDGEAYRMFRPQSRDEPLEQGPVRADVAAFAAV